MHGPPGEFGFACTIRARDCCPACLYAFKQTRGDQMLVGHSDRFAIALDDFGVLHTCPLGAPEFELAIMIHTCACCNCSSVHYAPGVLDAGGGGEYGNGWCTSVWMNGRIDRSASRSVGRWGVM